MPFLFICLLLAHSLFPGAVHAFREAVPDAWNGPPFEDSSEALAEGPPGLLTSLLEPGFPPTLYGLMEGNYPRDSARLLGIPGAGVSELLSDESRIIGTGLGLNLGPGLKFQGFGVYDMDEGSTFAGPALRYNLPGDLDFTTGVQVPLNDRGIASGSADFYFAEFRLLF